MDGAPKRGALRRRNGQVRGNKHHKVGTLSGDWRPTDGRHHVENRGAAGPMGCDVPGRWVGRGNIKEQSTKYVCDFSPQGQGGETRAGRHIGSGGISWDCVVGLLPDRRR